MSRRVDDCDKCARYYPGIGCNSEAELACGCCFTEITPLERIAQIEGIMKSCVRLLEYARRQIEND